MKIIKEEILIDEGGFGESEEYAAIHREIAEGISKVVWPPGNTKFTIYPDLHANGVKPIKKAFLDHLAECGWELENRVDLGVTKRPGPIDATCSISGKLFAVEWETGNISSSHRAINKMVIGILRGVLLGGALVLPTRELYPYLTDRIGNLRELEPYFDVWKSVKCENGFLTVIAVEHDETSKEVPPIPKGFDGLAHL
jgi:hypothetical protein